jgi:O-methyltransferase
MSFVEKLIRNVVGRLGYDTFSDFIPYLAAEEKKTIQTCQPFTQTGQARLFSLIRATEYIVKNRIPGAFIECGVWKGGSVMAIALTLERLGQAGDVYLFDTFKGMPPGTQADVDFGGKSETWYRREKSWNAISLQDVKDNLASLGPTRQRFHFIEGKVEDTLPNQTPPVLSLLRLDTDFYASTKHALVHLFPHLSKGGVLIIDDYGHFLGARQAVDEYFQEQNIHMLMHRIDYTGVIGIKVE